MHELSIANSLVELVGEQIAADELASVRSIKLCIGTLTCVHPDALRFCFDLITKDTPLQCAQLDIAIVPVSITVRIVMQFSKLQAFRVFIALFVRLPAPIFAVVKSSIWRCSSSRVHAIKIQPEQAFDRRGDSAMQPRILQVRTQILKKNDQLARQMRNQFEAAGVLTVNLVSSPGTGKTRLLTETLGRMRQRGLRVAAVVGDLETDNDARRLAESGAPVRQILTHGMCHLEADMVQQHLAGWSLEELDYLFIENVGNLVCPTSWDLGESIRVALLSVTEGEDKPLKYPGLFNTSDLAILTKVDLVEACEFNRAQALHASNRFGRACWFGDLGQVGTGNRCWIDYLIQARTNMIRNCLLPILRHMHSPGA